MVAVQSYKICLQIVKEKSYSFYEGNGDVKMSKQKFSITYWINVAIVFLLMFGFGKLPPITGISELGMKGIGIFLGMIWGWAMCDLAWPSFLGVVAVGLSGYMNVTQSFQKMFSDSTMLQMIFCFALIAYLQECGFATYVAKWFVSRKIGTGHPWIFSALILTTAFILSMFTMGAAAIVMTWVIYYEICHTLSMVKDDVWTKTMLVGIVIAGAAGALCLPYQLMSLLYIASVESVANVTVNTLIYSAFRIITSYGFILLYLLLIRFVIRPDITKLTEQLNKQNAYFAEMRMQKMNTSQKIGAISFAVVLFLLVVANNCPATWPLVPVIKSMGLIGVVGVLMVVLAIIYTKQDGVEKTVINIGSIMQKIDWVIVILVGCVAPISGLLESDEAGIFALITESLTPLGQAMGPTMFIFAMTLLIGVLTQVSHNVLLARVLMPLMVSVGITLNIDPMVMMMAVALPCQIAICTPGASGFAGLLWGNSNWIDTKSCAKYTLLGFLLMMLFNTVIVYPLAMIIY